MVGEWERDTPGAEDLGVWLAVAAIHLPLRLPPDELGSVRVWSEK